MPTYDLHIRFTPQKNSMEFNRLQKLASSLGFRGIAVESSKRDELKQTDESLEIFRRFTFSPRTAARLRFHVNKYLKQTDLLVIHGRTKPIWLTAAEISNVHMIMLKDVEDFLVIDSQVARVMAKQGKAVEICLNKLLTVSGSVRSRLMRAMGNAVKHLVRANCSLILTSGAQHLYELRAPKDMEALSFLASVPEELAIKSMNQYPIALISQLRESKEATQSNPRRREV